MKFPLGWDKSMIFQHTWPQIVARTKTVTRRLIAHGDLAVRGKNNVIVQVKHNGRTKWQIGTTYAVQPGRGETGIARICVARITQQQLKRISNTESQAEGFTNRQEFLSTWRTIHGSVDPNLKVWVIEFELVEVLPAAQQLQWDRLSHTSNWYKRHANQRLSYPGTCLP